MEFKFTKDNATPFIPININAQNVYVMLDTGASGSLLDSTFFQSLNKNYPLKDTAEVETALSDGILAPVYELPFTLDYNLFFEDFTIVELSGIINLEANFKPIVGILGSSFFLKYKCILDFKNLNFII